MSINFFEVGKPYIKKKNERHLVEPSGFLVCIVSEIENFYKTFDLKTSIVPRNLSIQPYFFVSSKKAWNFQKVY